MKKEGQLQLLICSANLGNAQPDVESLNHWVANDGNCQEVLLQEQYPIRRRIEYDDSELTFAEGYEEYSEHDQFDLVVFGLQESTFDPPTSWSKINFKEQLNNADENGGLMNNTIIDQGNKIIAKKTVSAIQTLAVGRDKTVSAIQTLTANRDHTKQQQQGGSSGDPLGDSERSSQQQQQQQWLGGTHVLHGMLEKRLPSYERIVSFQRGEMRLIILMRKGSVDVEVVHVSAQNTGRAGLANKGGIVAEVLVNGNTRLSFFTAHLEAHEGAEKYKQRVSTIADIFSGTKEKQHDCSLTAHYSFFMGDLNFRTELPNHKELGEEEHKRIIRQMVKEEDWDSLNKADELHRALQQGECLAGYETLFCNFSPTFKLEREAGYHYVDKRRPSYTDRILWKANHELENNVNPLIYEPIDDFASSDHKPIRAMFTVDLNKSLCFRPIMSRRRSVMNLRGILHKKKGDHEVAHRERFHLFLSEMSCSIHREGGKTNEPNPYVCLISDPRDAVQQCVRKGWSRLSHQLRRSLFRSRRFDETKFVTAKGWPRSSIKKQTFVANWHEEEIHAEVQTHRPDGSPIDLTGSMLRVTLMDSRSSSDDVLIGTFCFNIANLMRSCRPSTQESSRRILENREVDKQNPAGGVSGSLQQSPKPTKRQSLLNIFSKGKEDFAEDSDGAEDFDPITAVEIDAPLLKNGVEKGKIRCRIEAWWMDESTARAFGGGSAPLFGGSKRNSNRNTMGDGATFGTTADGRKMMLSPRHSHGRKRHSRWASKSFS